jgi:hypothetical protein
MAANLTETMPRALDVVIGDVHARTDALYALLRELNVIDAAGHRRRDGTVVQLGDLLDRKVDERANLETAELAVEALDLTLAGNHEWRMLEAGDHDDALALLAERGWPQAATAFDGWLITHAGVHPKFARDLPADAGACADEINRRWHAAPSRRRRDKLFTAVGPAREGSDPYGGILWLHSDEWPRKASAPWGQIAGHVPQAEPRLLPGPRWAIDIKAPDRLAALVRRQGERRWRPVVVKARSRRLALAA